MKKYDLFVDFFFDLFGIFLDSPGAQELPRHPGSLKTMKSLNQTGKQKKKRTIKEEQRTLCSWVFLNIYIYMCMCVCVCVCVCVYR